jgi:hypothetical protein
LDAVGLALFLAPALDATFFVERAGVGIASFPSCNAANCVAGRASRAGQAPEGAGV